MTTIVNRNIKVAILAFCCFACQVNVDNLNMKSREINKEQEFELVDLIAERSALFDIKNHSKGIVIIGDTGVGKSAFLNFIAQEKLIADHLPSSKSYVKKLVIHNNNESQRVKIGHEVTSETTSPNMLDIDKITFFDCPGFGHISGECGEGNNEIENEWHKQLQDIVNADYIAKILSNLKELKICLVLSVDALKDTRVTSFSNLFNRVSKSIPSLDELYKSVALLITKDENLTDKTTTQGYVDEQKNRLLSFFDENIKGKNILCAQAKNLLSNILTKTNNFLVWAAPHKQGNIDDYYYEDRLVDYKNYRKFFLTTFAKMPFSKLPKVNPRNLLSDRSIQVLYGVRDSILLNLKSECALITKNLNEELLNRISNEASSYKEALYILSNFKESFEELKRMTQSKKIENLNFAIINCNKNLDLQLLSYKGEKSLQCIPSINIMLGEDERDISSLFGSFETNIFKELEKTNEYYDERNKATIVDGHLLTSDKILKCTGNCKYNKLVVIAKSILFLENDLPFYKRDINEVYVFAKRVVVNNSITIDMRGSNGKEGKNAEEHSNAKQIDYTGNGLSGNPGEPGLPGGLGGNFYMTIANSKGSVGLEKVNVNVSGGDGGSGGNGACGGSVSGGNNDEGEMINKLKSLVENGEEKERNNYLLKSEEATQEVRGKYGLNRLIGALKWVGTMGNKAMIETYIMNGKPGKSGGSGGQGGSGGRGGLSGNCLIVDSRGTKLSPINIIAHRGNEGNNGNSGKPGYGCSVSADIQGVYFREYAFGGFRGINEQSASQISRQGVMRMSEEALTIMALFIKENVKESSKQAMASSMNNALSQVGVTVTKEACMNFISNGSFQLLQEGSKEGLMQLTELLGKEGMSEIFKQISATTMTEIAKEGTKEIAKEGTKEIVKEGTKEIVKEGTKEVAKKSLMESGKEVLSSTFKGANIAKSLGIGAIGSVISANVSDGWIAEPSIVPHKIEFIQGSKPFGYNTMGIVAPKGSIGFNNLLIRQYDQYLAGHTK